METWKIVIVLILLVAIPVGGAFAKRSAMRWARGAGERRLGARIDQEATSLSGVIDVQADQTQVAALVSGVVGSRKRWKATGPGEWVFSNYADDDLIARLGQQPTGTRLYLVRTIDIAERPQHVREWVETRDAVAAAATSAGLGVTTAQHPPLQRVAVAATNTLSNHTWVLPGS